MRSPTARLASVAAMVAIAAIVISLLPRLSNSAYAIDQTVEAMGSVRFVHVVGRNDTGEIDQERWIEIGPNGHQIRYRHDKPPHLFVVDDGSQTARYHSNQKAVVLCPHGTRPYRWIEPLGAMFENLRCEGMIVEEDVRFRGRRVHKVWWPLMRNVCYVDPETKRAIAIGNVELSYEAPPAGIFDIVTPEGYDVVKGPLDLSRETAEREGFCYVDVEISQPEGVTGGGVNRDDVIRLYPTKPLRYEGDLDLNVKCDANLSWGLSIAKSENIEGTYSCRVDRFNLSRPGGIVTVGVTVETAKAEDLQGAGKIGTLRLELALRPDPMSDARACQTLGLTLYDAKRYKEALSAFEKMERAENADDQDRAVALIWQGHMLDLLDRRDEAVTKYRKVVDMHMPSNTGIRDDRYGLAYHFTPYALERIKTPFARVENRDEY